MFYALETYPLAVLATWLQHWDRQEGVVGNFVEQSSDWCE